MFGVYLFARGEKGETGKKPFYRRRIYQLSGKRLIAGSMHRRVTKLTLYDQEMAGFNQTEGGAFIRKLSELDIYESTCSEDICHVTFSTNSENYFENVIFLAYY